MPIKYWFKQKRTISKYVEER